MRWQAEEQVSKITETIGVVTALSVSHEWAHFGHPAYVRVEAVIAAATNVGTQTLTLQQKVGGTWVTLMAKTFTTAGTQLFLINTDTDHKLLVPVADRMRLVLTQTNAGDKATLTSIRSFQYY